MAIILGIAAIVLGYLLGSIPSAYMLGRLWGKIDLRKEGDGHISATAVYRYLGRVPFLFAIIMDIGKGILAIYLASLLTDFQIILVLVAYATVVGHCWSIFLGFKGGLGGTVIFAVLLSLALKETFIGVGVFLLVLVFTRKTSWGTYILLGVTSAALLIERQSLVLGLYPLGLVVIHWLKRFQTQKANPRTAYTHEALDDLKRIR